MRGWYFCYFLGQFDKNELDDSWVENLKSITRNNILKSSHLNTSRSKNQNGGNEKNIAVLSAQSVLCM